MYVCMYACLDREFGYGNLLICILPSVFFIRISLNSFSVRFARPKLKDHMQYCIDHPEEMDKMAKVKAQVSEVKGIMMENIEKVSSIFLLFLLTCLYVCKYIYLRISMYVRE